MSIVKSDFLLTYFINCEDSGLLSLSALQVSSCSPLFVAAEDADRDFNSTLLVQFVFTFLSNYSNRSITPNYWLTRHGVSIFLKTKKKERF